MTPTASVPSPLLHALLTARPDTPAPLREFDRLVRGQAPEPGPSFEEYSARVGAHSSPWRETSYFDVGNDPSLVELANTRFGHLAQSLGVAVPARFLQAIQGASAGPEVLQIVLGLDASPDRLRLKYYLIYRNRSGRSVETLREALDLPPLPASLQPDSVYILGVDFRPAELSDFKLYVRLDPARVPRVIRNLAQFEALWRGSRYLVFQHCLLSSGRQVYFHASSATLLERWLRGRAKHEPAVAALVDRQLPAMNRALETLGHDLRLRPWIASLPYERGQLLPTPSNVYFHLSEPG